MTEPMQLFPALPAAVEDALRASIKRFGVLVPVVKDQNGQTLDGHHRSRIADELNVDYRVDTVVVADDVEAREIAHTLNSDRRQLTLEQRQEVAIALRQQHSLRAIAGALGVSKSQVHRDLATVPDGTVPDRTVGLDGKSRPAKKPSVVAAKNRKEAERAAAALASQPTLPTGRVIDVKRAERIAREAASERLRLVTPPTYDQDDIEVRHGDFADVLDDLVGKVDAIITDPPYPERHYELYETLGYLARRLLRPGGVLAVMIGSRPHMLNEIEHRLGQSMRIRWRCAYLTSGPAWRDHNEKVSSNWKPVLLYSRPDDLEYDRDVTSDLFVSSGDDKTHHHWGQSETGMAQIVERLTRPGELVVDPFLGGGTMAVVCRDLSRRFVGCDIDAAAIARSTERLTA